MLDEHEMIDLSETIQDDIVCLLAGFDVDTLQNHDGKTIAELACQIVVDRFKRIS